jgi:hypothetical protein
MNLPYIKTGFNKETFYTAGYRQAVRNALRLAARPLSRGGIGGAMQPPERTNAILRKDAASHLRRGVARFGEIRRYHRGTHAVAKRARITHPT